MKLNELTGAEYHYFRQNCPFSDREIAVLDLCRRGASLVETALTLHVSTATVSRVRRSIQRKIARELG